MFQSSGLGSRSLRERLGEPVGRRAVGFAAALVLEALLLLALLSLNQRVSGTKESVTVVDLAAHDMSEAPPTPEPSASPAARAPAPRALTPPPPAEAPAPVPSPLPVVPPPPAAVIPLPSAPPAPPAPAAPKIGVRVNPGVTYGPAAPASGSDAYADTARVGTAPNGEPMYAASWYTKPTDSQLSGYLSTASGPGWGLIACKTVPDFRVEDCVGLSEWPEGSQINRAVLAAAWQFRVRPPRKGGQVLVGSWVRIRIDYDVKRERGG